MELLVPLLLAFVVGGVGYVFGNHVAAKRNRKVEDKTPPVIPQIGRADLRDLETRILSRLSSLPSDVVISVTNTANTHKGKLGELVGYVSIKGEYDRIIPLGNIVDFIGIKFPTSTTPGRIDFIDIKTGSAARLSREQSQLKKLLVSKAVSFRTVRIDDIEGLDVAEKDSTTPDS